MKLWNNSIGLYPTPSKNSEVGVLQNTITSKSVVCLIYLAVWIIHVSEPPSPFVRISLPVQGSHPPSVTIAIILFGCFVGVCEISPIKFKFVCILYQLSIRFHDSQF